MANLPTKSFAVLVQSIAAGMQGRASAILDFKKGSTLRAISESTAGVTLWLQSLILKVLLTTRASTAQDSDLDSWMADFGLSRLSPSPATGAVTFSRFTATAVGFIPVGAQVRTGDLTQTYIVVADGVNANFSTGQNGYILPPGLSSIVLPITALEPSSSSNAAPNTITVIATALAGIDTVNNVGALTNGADAETDEAFRARFPLFIASLSKATNAAVLYAVQSLQLSVQAVVVENEDYSGARHPGTFYVVVDDGSGTPSQALLDQIGIAIELVRPLGVSYAVFAPQIVAATIAISVTSLPGYDHNVIVGLVAQAVKTYVNNLPLGASLEYLKIAQVALDASRGVGKITSLSLNGQRDTDLTVTAKNLIKISTLTVV